MILVAFATSAAAVEKPAMSPDAPAPFVTLSRISAAIEFGLPALAADIQRDIPQRLATFNERINCVHRRVLVFKINANCNIRGYVERTSPVSLYGKGDRLFGAISVYGAVAGEGANRITAHIHGEAEARATVEAEARPQLQPDWSLALNFSDGFHWNEPPYLHVLGHDIALARHVEPRIREQLARLRTRVLAKARALDLHAKAASAWQQAFEPIKLADAPEIWLQIKPQGAAFAGVHADGHVLRGSLQIAGDAQTFIGHAPPAVAPTPLAPLGTAVAEPGTFDIVLPLHIGYGVLRQSVMQAVAAMPKGEMAIRDVEIYPSAGKIVVGLRVAKSSEPDAGAGEWVYLSAKPQVEAKDQMLKIPDLAAASNIGQSPGEGELVERLRSNVSVGYQALSQKLLDAVNQKLTRPLKNGFRMEGHLASANVDKIQLLPDGIDIALRASGALKILYGL